LWGIGIMSPYLPLSPISDATRGHGTHTHAAVWKDYLIAFLAQTERK
jgi:homoserine O-acetyltransferase